MVFKNTALLSEERIDKHVGQALPSDSDMLQGGFFCIFFFYDFLKFLIFSVLILNELNFFDKKVRAATI